MVPLRTKISCQACVSLGGNESSARHSDVCAAGIASTRSGKVSFSMGVTSLPRLDTAVGAGHARPACVWRPAACGKALSLRPCGPPPSARGLAQQRLGERSFRAVLTFPTPPPRPASSRRPPRSPLPRRLRKRKRRGSCRPAGGTAQARGRCRPAPDSRPSAD